MNSTLADLKTRLSAAFDDGADRELAFHPMFGILCVYVNGHVFSWVTKLGLTLKIDEGTGQTWVDKGAHQLQFDPDGPIFKSFFIVPPSIVNDNEALSEWVEQSVTFVLSQPKDKPKARSKRRV